MTDVKKLVLNTPPSEVSLELLEKIITRMFTSDLKWAVKQWGYFEPEEVLNGYLGPDRDSKSIYQILAYRLFTDPKFELLIYEKPGPLILFPSEITLTQSKLLMGLEAVRDQNNDRKVFLRIMSGQFNDDDIDTLFQYTLEIF